VASLNEGLSEARGEYIARMDADDISFPRRLSTQLKYMERSPEVGVSGTWVRVFGNGQDTTWHTPVAHDVIKSQLLFDCPIAHPSAMIRASFLRDSGLSYDENCLLAEDWDLWQRASDYTLLANIPKPLVRYRVYEGSSTQSNQQMQDATIFAIHERNLKRLGCEYGAEELRLHRKIGAWEFSRTLNFVIDSERWLLHLKECNDSEGVYPKEAFHRVLGERWAGLVFVAASAKIGVWRRFSGSPLTRFVKNRHSKLGRLWFKSI